MHRKTKHEIEEVCQCIHCRMITKLFRISSLSFEDQKFISNMLYWRSFDDYTPPQKARIAQIYNSQANLGFAES